MTPKPSPSATWPPRPTAPARGAGPRPTGTGPPPARPPPWACPAPVRARAPPRTPRGARRSPRSPPRPCSPGGPPSRERRSCVSRATPTTPRPSPTYAAASTDPHESRRPRMTTELIQLLTPEGKRVDHPGYAFDPGPDQLRSLYRDMVLTRRIDAEAVTLQRQGELALWPSLLGQEAAQIGSGRAARDDDRIFPSYREHGVAFVRDVDPVHLLTLFRGAGHGSWDPAEHNFHTYTLVIGSQVLHATGYAMGVAKDGADAAVIAYFGDGATSQGDVAEAFNFAAVYDAPVVFFCQNNQWAISESNERQSRVPLHQRARGFGFPGVRVDGNDVLACLAVTRAALDHARSGRGPMLIEAYTYRMGAHTTSDDPTRYRDSAEVAEWEAKDPILRLGRHLRSEGLADEAYFAALATESEALGKRVRDLVRTMPDPPHAEMFRHVYADGHALVEEERAGFTAYQEAFASSAAGEADQP
ncbi:pyruvate dehydrogenase (acetyl-transferring) E1 component subunit alpha [Streptomyces sp. AM 2-1-1]|uniref:pyruvate dehydrogenase (acetyl-transferring) E1 component subunit alpha n=1 Tax=Streptomyces sp. AM 2-1-1 TaxID=3028709 RepID=UPI0023B928BE|nr:pyruvate dehydrogenase (acetyl-transferring) E1 component subunit alpha [Streptomyces sp. AM 2-1-1]WEH39045.1 pyruvate dehydrogenase (acetyl-transferring) E1 component subunit alpha [Streptomyces sp. AM 2-1-1]